MGFRVISADSKRCRELQVEPLTDGCEECDKIGRSHPIMRSFEPGESWSWRYVDEAVVA